MLENANALKEQFLEKVNSASSSNELEQLRIEFLGKKGPITSLMSELRNIPNEQKKGARSGVEISMADDILPYVRKQKSLHHRCRDFSTFSFILRQPRRPL